MGQGPTRGYGQRPPVVMPAPTDCFPAPHASRSPRIWAAGVSAPRRPQGLCQVCSPENGPAIAQAPGKEMHWLSPCTVHAAGRRSPRRDTGFRLPAAAGTESSFSDWLISISA